MNLKFLSFFAFLLVPYVAQAECAYFDGFVENGNGTITDPRNGLVWMKCSVGENWDAKEQRCLGTAKELDWFEAMQSAKAFKFVKKADWRLPGPDEINSILGKFEQCVSRVNPKGRALSTAILPGPLAGTREGVWTYSESISPEYRKEIWAFAPGVSNNDGGHRMREWKQSALLVRAGDLASKSAFESEYAKLRETKLKYLAAVRADEARSKSESEARCSSHYPGKTGKYNRGGWLGTDDSYIVRYVNKDRQLVTLEGTSGGNSLKFGQMLELDCSELR